MTLKLLHYVYSHRARDIKKIPYTYRTFRHYVKYAKKYKLTMPIRCKPSEIMTVDWAKNTLSIKDKSTGEKPTIYVFVATLPYSQLFYAGGKNQAYSHSKSTLQNIGMENNKVSIKLPSTSRLHVLFLPYEYVQSQVDVRVTRDVIEVYFKDIRITS